MRVLTPKLAAELEGDERVGVLIVKRALEQPLRTLCSNAGLEGSVIVEQIKKEKKTAPAAPGGPGGYGGEDF